MSENLANLRNYRIQLKQVETALASEPDNDDLKGLHKDLNEVIRLIMSTMGPEELAELESLESDGVVHGSNVNHNFRAGDHVLAPWSVDGQFYEAQIEDITSDGQCTVVFNHQKKRISEVCLVNLLKPLGKKKSSKPVSSGSSSFSYSSEAQPTNTMHQFKKTQEVREAQRRKQQKRKEKLKELEDEREKDKMKWQSFANKANHKKLKGSTKKSIFASPDSVSGRVGVGTCGVGGRPMTEYQMQKVEKKSSSNLPKLSLT